MLAAFFHPDISRTCAQPKKYVCYPSLQKLSLARQALDSRKLSGDEARFFADLNHLFMTVEGESSVASYQTPGHVAPEVVKVIAEWIKARSK